MATNPPSVEESLAEPKQPKVGTRLAKNLHIIIPGILVALLAVVLISDAAKKDQESGPKSVADQAAAEIKSKSSLDNTGGTIDDELKRQRTAPLNTQTDLPGLPPVPSSLKQDSTPAVPAGPVAVGGHRDEQDRAELEKAKREEQIRSSALLALSGNGAASTAGRVIEGATGPVADTALPPQIAQLRKQADEQSARARQMQEELLGSVRNSVKGGTRGGLTVPAKGDDNSGWLNSVSERSGEREIVKLDPPGPEPIIHQGVIIPAVLVTELNSDLPGQLSAMVTMDVYDSIRGSNLLIPKGSKLVGSYNNSLTSGQERVMAAFTRIIRPDGSSIDLKAMPAADAVGQSGLNDEVDNHFWKMFSTSFLVAGLAYLFETHNQPDTVVVGGGGTSGQGLGSEAGKVLVDVSRTVLDRYRVIPPTLHIRKGYKFNVVVNRDIAIPAYR